MSGKNKTTQDKVALTSTPIDLIDVVVPVS